MKTRLLLAFHYMLLVSSAASKAWEWMKDYFGSFQLDPRQELAKIPPHSSFFIFDHENRYLKNISNL